MKNLKRGLSLAMLVLLSIMFSLSACASYADDPASLYHAWPEEYKQALYEICQEYELQDQRSYLLAIIWNESRFQSNAEGHNKNGTVDRGLMQINDACIPFLKGNDLLQEPEDLFDPVTNMECGACLFRYHLDAVENADHALLRYQVGEGAFHPGLTTPVFEKVCGIRYEYDNILDDLSVIATNLSLNDFLELQKTSSDFSAESYLSNDPNSFWVDVLNPSELYEIDFNKTVYVKTDVPVLHEYLKNNV